MMMFFSIQYIAPSEVQQKLLNFLFQSMREVLEDHPHRKGTRTEAVHENSLYNPQRVKLFSIFQLSANSFEISIFNNLDVANINPLVQFIRLSILS